MKDMGMRKHEDKDNNEETETGNYCTGAVRVSRLHNLLSCHNRPNGDGIQMPV